MNRSSQNEQMALQRGSLAVAILSQVSRDDENNKPLFAEARNLLHEILRKGVAMLQEAGDDDDDDETDEEAASDTG
jgi:hypothetical protein